VPRPAYLRVKGWILERVRSGALRQGDLVPSEPALARRFGVARMTANRAVRELAAERVLTRARGAGTYVAAPTHGSTLVEIRSIAAEIEERGRIHTARVLELARRAATPAQARDFRRPAGAPLFRSRVVHAEDGVPVQYEDRWVDAALVPGYGERDFSRETPNEYLVRAAPLERVEYRIEARRAPPAVRRALAVEEAEPCLLLHRRTFSRGRVASVADLWHPGERWQFTGHF